jgi:hypothetical protein
MINSSIYVLAVLLFTVIFESCAALHGRSIQTLEKKALEETISYVLLIHIAGWHHAVNPLLCNSTMS